MCFAHGILTARLADFPSAHIHIGINRHNVGSRDFHIHNHGVGHLAEFTNHLSGAVAHTLQHASVLTDGDNAFIEAGPSECEWTNAHGVFAESGLNIYCIFLKTVGDDGIVGDFDVVDSINNSHRFRHAHTLVSGSEHAFAHRCVGIESRIGDDIAQRLVAREFHTLHILAHEHTIFIVAIEFRGIYTVFREFEREIHEANACDSAVVGGRTYHIEGVAIGTLCAVAGVVANTEGTGVEHSRATTVHVDTVGSTCIAHNVGKPCGAHTARQW